MEKSIKVQVSLLPGKVLLADYVTRSVINRSLKEYNKLSIDDTTDIMREVAELTGADMTFEMATLDNMIMATMKGAGGILFRVGFGLRFDSPAP